MPKETTKPNQLELEIPASVVASESIDEPNRDQLIIEDTNPTATKYGSRVDQYWKIKGMKPAYQKWIKNRNIPVGAIDQAKAVKEFKLKGFEYGNWMEQNTRYAYLVATVVSLEHLRHLTGIENIGMSNIIGIGMGSRGQGGAAAHFEPGTFMINLTKYNGAGALAHEYGHALDYFFGTYFDQDRASCALTFGDTTATRFSPEQIKSGELRKLACQVVATYMWKGEGEAVFESDQQTDSYKRLKAKTVNRYWHLRNEIFARCFEDYINRKSIKDNLGNIFLTEKKYDLGYYPDNTDAERIAPIFDKLLLKMKNLVDHEA